VLRFGIVGTGFWAQFQLAAWQELQGVECVALCNRTRSKAEAMAHRFGIAAVYSDAEEMLAREQLDFLDVIADATANPHFVQLAARHQLPIICQKPMAPDLESAGQMVQICQDAEIPLMIHENWRWQRPIQEFKRALVESPVGRPFRGHFLYANNFPVFENQPYLREVEHFILADMGSHILDVARYLFGEATQLTCQTRRVTPGIKGEDVATVMLAMKNDAIVTCSLSYASQLEGNRFPETFIRAECEHGSVELCPDYWVKVTTQEGTFARRYPPQRYTWAAPGFELVQAAIVPCNAHLRYAIQNGEPAETSGEDNLKTIRLVFGAYESARTGHSVQV